MEEPDAENTAAFEGANLTPVAWAPDLFLFLYHVCTA
jgi:hypothetical protein